MPTSPEEIQLQPEQQKMLADIAEDEQRSWNDVFADAIRLYRLTCDPSYNPERVPGNGIGRIWMSDDFDAPLEFAEAKK